MRFLESMVNFFEKRPFQLILAALFFTMLIFSLYHTALSSGFRFDDFDHLNFAMKYSPVEYFFIPELMHKQSYAHITPWNALFYDMTLSFFKFAPQGYYIHLLFVLSAISFLLFIIFRQFLNGLFSFLTVCVFICFPSTAAMTHMLMVGHYVYGLLFSIIALFAWQAAFNSKNSTGKRWGYSILGAFFYAQACLCKELYVPLIGVIAVLPLNVRLFDRQRILMLFPWVIVAGGYLFLRNIVVDGFIGSYEGSLKYLTSFSFFLNSIYNLFKYVLGGGKVYLFYAIVLIMFMFLYKDRLRALKMKTMDWHHVSRIALLCAAVIVGTLFPLIVSGLSDLSSKYTPSTSPATLRLIFVFCLVFAIFLGLTAEQLGRKGVVLICSVIAVEIYAHQKTIKNIFEYDAVFYNDGNWLMKASPEKILLPHSSYVSRIWERIAQDRVTLYGGQKIRILHNETDTLTALINNQPVYEIGNFIKEHRVTLYGYKKTRLEPLIADIKKGMEKLPHMSVDITAERLDNNEIKIKWRLSPGLPDTQYRFNFNEFLHIKNQFYAEDNQIPSEGEMIRRVQGDIQFLIQLEHKKEKWLAHTPTLTIHGQEKIQKIHWEGRPVCPRNLCEIELDK